MSLQIIDLYYIIITLNLALTVYNVIIDRAVMKRPS